MLRFRTTVLMLSALLLITACSTARPAAPESRPTPGGAAPRPDPPATASAPAGAVPAQAKRPTVQVEDADGPVADLSRPARMALGDSALTLRFDRPMDRAGVEQQLSAGAYLLLPGYNLREPKLTADLRKPVTLTFTWESDTELNVAVPGLGRFQLGLGGLPAQAGQVTADGTLEAWRPDSSMGTLEPKPDAKPAKVGYWPSFLFDRTYSLTQVHPDGHAMLFIDAMETGFASEYQPWLWTGNLHRLPDTYYAGNTFMAELLPAGKGAIVADSQKVRLYGPDGAGKVIWQTDRLIHGIGLAASGDRLAIFVHGDGDDVRLIVIDPLAADPSATAVDFGVVDHEALKPSNTEVSRHRRIRGLWAPDGSEIAWGGGAWQEGGMVWAPFYSRFRLSDRHLTGRVEGLEVQGWSPDGKLMLFTTGYRSVQGQPDLKTVIKSAAGGETVQELPGDRWRFGDPDLLWRPEPFQWLRIGGTVEDGPAGWIPIGWLTMDGADHRFATIPTPKSRE